jgi:hypothetical protein
MSTAPNIAALRFVENGDQAREAIAAAANALIRSHRASPRLRVCVAGDELPAKTIAALISALRKLREVGGALEVRAENEAPRRIILRHGLERVFEFPPLDAAPAEERRPSPIAATLRRAGAALGSFIGQSPGPYREAWWMVW